MNSPPRSAFGASPPGGRHPQTGEAGSAVVRAQAGGHDALLDERALSKLRWRCRRGLLENDLFIERFFNRHESGLTVGQADGLNMLMDLADNDLLDLLLARKEPEGEINTSKVRQVLEMLRSR